nr:hypothetical protein [Tanacetum cinerariifolium]
GEDGGRGFHIAQGQRNVVEAAGGYFCAHFGSKPGRARVISYFGQLQLQAVGVEKGEVALAKLLGGLVVGYALGFKALHPEIEAALGHRVADFGGLAGAAAAGRHVLPGKEREDGARRAGFKPRVGGAIEVHGGVGIPDAERWGKAVVEAVGLGVVAQRKLGVLVYPAVGGALLVAHDGGKLVGSLFFRKLAALVARRHVLELRLRIAQRVLVVHGTGQQHRDDFHVGVGVQAKALFGGYVVVVEDLEQAKAVALGVGIRAKAEREVAFEPAYVFEATVAGRKEMSIHGKVSLLLKMSAGIVAAVIMLITQHQGHWTRALSATPVALQPHPYSTLLMKNWLALALSTALLATTTSFAPPRPAAPAGWTPLLDKTLSKWRMYESHRHVPGDKGLPPKDTQGQAMPPIGYDKNEA